MFVTARWIPVFGTFGSILLGWHQQLWWLAVPPTVYLAYVVWRDVEIRSRIGSSAWASDGFARFLVVADIALMLRNVIGNAVFFTLAALARQQFGV